VVERKRKEKAEKLKLEFREIRQGRETGAIVSQNPEEWGARGRRVSGEKGGIFLSIISVEDPGPSEIGSHRQGYLRLETQLRKRKPQKKTRKGKETPMTKSALKKGEEPSLSPKRRGSEGRRR